MHVPRNKDVPYLVLGESKLSGSASLPYSVWPIDLGTLCLQMKVHTQLIFEDNLQKSHPTSHGYWGLGTAPFSLLVGARLYCYLKQRHLSGSHSSFWEHFSPEMTKDFRNVTEALKSRFYKRVKILNFVPITRQIYPQGSRTNPRKIQKSLIRCFSEQKLSWEGNKMLLKRSKMVLVLCQWIESSPPKSKVTDEYGRYSSYYSFWEEDWLRNNRPLKA